MMENICTIELENGGNKQQKIKKKYKIEKEILPFHFSDIIE